MNGVNFQVARGEIKIILSGSGGGKSTILKLILGLLKPDAGQIFIDGEEITECDVQDGYNLAWKIALVLQDKAAVTLLETYNEERLENAKHLLKTTDRLFEFAAGTEWLLEFLRTSVLPPIAKYIFGLNPVKKVVFPLLSQIGINYRHSSLSKHTGDEHFKVKAGDRMPYFMIDGASIYDKLHEPKFHLLSFSDGQDDPQFFKAELDNRYARLCDFNAIPLSPEAAEAFGKDEPFSVLLRPDNYIGFISTNTSMNGLIVDLRKFVGNSKS